MDHPTGHHQHADTDTGGGDEVPRQHLIAALQRVAAAGRIADAVARLVITEAAKPYRVYHGLQPAAQKALAATLALHGPPPVADYLRAVTSAINTHTHDPDLADRALAYLTRLHRQAGIHPANPHRINPTNPDSDNTDSDEEHR